MPSLVTLEFPLLSTSIVGQSCHQACDLMQSSLLMFPLDRCRVAESAEQIFETSRPGLKSWEFFQSFVPYFLPLLLSTEYNNIFWGFCKK